MPKSFPGLTEDVWVPAVMSPQLIPSVPENVIKLFEVARGSILYGWFFYPLLTLASEQLDRVHETAIKERCKSAGVPTTRTNKSGKTLDRKFVELINDLSAAGIILPESQPEWDAVRRCRNWSSHPKDQMIDVPGGALAAIESTALRLNQLFSPNPDAFSRLALRVRKSTGFDEQPREFPTAVGIDVGEFQNGYYVVALQGSRVVSHKRLYDPNEILQWCLNHAAEVVAIDAPCGWSEGGEFKSREGERVLATCGFQTYYTPTRDAAASNPFYGWVFNGERLYQALAAKYPLFRGGSYETGTPICFETFPHAAACAFAGARFDANNKRTDRRRILRAAGLDDSVLTGIHFVDAAICALVANAFSVGYCTLYGNEKEGFIVTPNM